MWVKKTTWYLADDIRPIHAYCLSNCTISLKILPCFVIGFDIVTKVVALFSTSHWSRMQNFISVSLITEVTLFNHVIYSSFIFHCWQYRSSEKLNTRHISLRIEKWCSRGWYLATLTACRAVNKKSVVIVEIAIAFSPGIQIYLFEAVHWTGFTGI